MPRKSRRVPQADSVQWIGLCPCGCGAYKAVLLDENRKTIAAFGWDREGWISFTEGALSLIEGGEPDEAAVCHHTAH